MPAEIQPTNDASTDWTLLNDRQRKQAEDLAELSLEFGMFDQTTGADGAHYAPADKNPFKAEGLKCGNCVFFNESNNQCQIVAGIIEPEAVCKLWVIPETSLAAKREATWVYIKGIENGNA